jgi:regulator of sigma E protease
MATLTAIFLTVVFLSVLIIGHELGHFFAAKISGVEVREFGFGYPPRLFKRKYRGTIYSFNAIPFGGFVNIAGLDSEEKNSGSGATDFQNQSFSRKTLIILGGVLVNFLMAWSAFLIVYLIGAPQTVYVAGVSSGSAAAAAGLAAGDQIAGFVSSADLINYVESHRGLNIDIKVRRQAEVVDLPIFVPPEKSASGRLGLQLVDIGVPRVSPGAAISVSLSETCRTLGSVADSFISLFRERNFADLSGPVGVWNAIRFADRLGFGYLLQLFAFISLNLVFINVLPLPALDGGRFIFLLAGTISRRPLSRRIETLVHSAFFAILLFLMIVVTIKDIVRLF